MKDKFFKLKLILAVFCLSAVSLLIGVPTIPKEKLEHLIQAENQQEVNDKVVIYQEIL